VAGLAAHGAGLGADPAADGVRLPPGTAVHQAAADGPILRAELAEPTSIRGVRVSGSVHGPWSSRLAGTLWGDQRIDGVLLADSTSVELGCDAEGCARLRQGTVEEPTSVDGVDLPAGAQVQLDGDGQLVRVDLPGEANIGGLWLSGSVALGGGQATDGVLARVSAVGPFACAPGPIALYADGTLHTCDLEAAEWEGVALEGPVEVRPNGHPWRALTASPGPVKTACVPAGSEVEWDRSGRLRRVRPGPRAVVEGLEEPWQLQVGDAWCFGEVAWTPDGALEHCAAVPRHLQDSAKLPCQL
jgi:hypothetical protein